jgi:hypothetical protein
LKINNPPATFNSKSHADQLSRNMTTATGTQAITGVGFTPTKLVVFAILLSTLADSNGVSDSNKTGQCVFTDYAGLKSADISLVNLVAAVAASQVASVVSYDADGFTLSWVKNGAPTGVAYLAVLSSN